MREAPTTGQELLVQLLPNIFHVQHTRVHAQPSSWNLPNDSICAWTFLAELENRLQMCCTSLFTWHNTGQETPTGVSSGAGWTRWSFAVVHLCCPFSLRTLVPGLAGKGALKDSWAPAELGSARGTSSWQKVWFSTGRLDPLGKSESAACPSPVQREAPFAPAEHSRRAHQTGVTEAGELGIHGDPCRLSVHLLATFSTRPPPLPWLADGCLPVRYWNLGACQTGFHTDGEQPKWDFSTLISTDRHCSGVGWKIICLLISCIVSLWSEETTGQDSHFTWSLFSFIVGKTRLSGNQIQSDIFTSSFTDLFTRRDHSGFQSWRIQHPRKSELHSSSFCGLKVKSEL